MWVSSVISLFYWHTDDMLTILPERAPVFWVSRAVFIPWLRAPSPCHASFCVYVAWCVYTQWCEQMMCMWDDIVWQRDVIGWWQHDMLRMFEMILCVRKMSGCLCGLRCWDVKWRVYVRWSMVCISKLTWCVCEMMCAFEIIRMIYNFSAYIDGQVLHRVGCA